MDKNEEEEEKTTKFDHWVNDLSKIDLRKRIHFITFLSLIFSILFFSLTFYLLTTKVELNIIGEAIVKEKNEKKLTFYAPIHLEQLSYIKDSDSVNIIFEGKPYKGFVSEKNVIGGKGSINFIVKKSLTLSKDSKINFSIPVLKKSYLDLLIENKDSFL